MQKVWGFEAKKKSNKVNVFVLWKASIFIILFTILLSFFSIVNDVVYARKTNLLNKIDEFSKLSFLYKNNIPSSIAKFIVDYKNNKNILKNKQAIIFIENKLATFISLLWYGKYKEQILSIYKWFQPYRDEILNLLWKNKEKNYLIILENTGEERPDGGFFGSFMKVSLYGWHLKSFKIIDSYKVIFDQCKLKTKNWYRECDRKNLHIYHNLKDYKPLFKYTSFLSSNFFGFTKLNWENIIAHYKKAYPNEEIDGVIFVKSDILKYLIQDGEKIIWKMETTNYKNLIKKKTWKLDKWIKDEYLEYTKKLLLSNKKQIIENFIKNYEKIRKQWLIRFYFKWISKDFQNYLKEQNFIYYNDEKSAYLFFYNVWNNKSSKFTDHIVNINNKIYINPNKLPLLKWKNIILYKSIYIENPSYFNFLEKENIPKDTFLWSEDVKHYNVLLIVPKNCSKQKVSENKYIVDCK